MKRKVRKVVKYSEFTKVNIGENMNTYECQSVELVEIVMAGFDCKPFKDDDDSCYSESITPPITPIVK